MPTGYTAAIRDGISFKDFAMGCARAFDACVSLHDELGGGGVIPEQFEPSPRAKDIAEAARGDLAMLLSLTPDEIEQQAAAHSERVERARLLRLEEKRNLRASYGAMKARVEAWEPPTPSHCRLRTFMLEQIETSIDVDCCESSYDRPTLKMTGAEWFAMQRDELQKSIEYHERHYAKDAARCEASTAWVRALRASL